MVGLGWVCANMVGRLLDGDHACVVYDLNPANVDSLVKNGAAGSRSLANLVQGLAPPRAVWMMVPSGAATERTVAALADVVEPDDLIVDGGNTYFKDDLRRSAMLKSRGIGYVDVWTSGGVWGATRGYWVMIGGETAHVDRLNSIFRMLAPWCGEIEQTAGARDARRYGGTGVSALWSGGRRSLREDGAQRDRIRRDAGVGRGVRNHAQRRRGGPVGRDAVCVRSLRYRGGAASG